MARRPHEEQELPFVALMDTMTNVVGVLIIVLVMIGLSIASAVKKVLSELPPVTPEQHQKLLDEVKQQSPLPADPKQLEADMKKLQAELLQVDSQIKTIDVSDIRQRLKLMDLEDIKKQIEEKKTKERDPKREEVNKLLAEIERIKGLIDSTPKYTPPPPTFVRLPNPRPYPEKPVEHRILVSKDKIYFYNEAEYLAPLVAGLDKSRSQLRYKTPRPDPFVPMLEKVMGDKAGAQKVWLEIAPLAGTFQLDQIAQGYKILVDGGIPANGRLMLKVGNLSMAVRKPVPEVAAAIVASTKNDVSKWAFLNPSTDPLKPAIKAEVNGAKATFTWYSQVVEVRANPKDMLGYFEDLAEIDSIKDISKSREVFDAFAIEEMMKRAASNQLFTKTFDMKPSIRPGSTLVQLALTPRSDGGETLAQIKEPNSNFTLSLRNIKNDPNGVAVFQVMPDAFATYLDARTVADEVGVPATWEFLANLNLTANVQGFEVQRFAVQGPQAPRNPNQVIIAPPKKTLD